MEKFEIDNIDKVILNALLQDASLPYTKIATMANISDGTVHIRIKKMIAAGIIHGSTFLINPKAIGYDLMAFVGIYLEKGADYKHVIEKLEHIKQVVEAHFTTGMYSIFIKIICKNSTDLRDILNDQVQSIPGVQRTETTISLENKIFRPMQLL